MEIETARLIYISIIKQSEIGYKYYHLAATANIAFQRTNVAAKWIELEIGKNLKEIKLK